MGVWDASFAVFYPDMDEEHKPLFTCIEELKTKREDKALLESCLESYIFHFNHEQSLFKNSTLYPSEEQYQHINKHDAFLVTMKGLTVPVATEWIDYAANWLTQHIKTLTLDTRIRCHILLQILIFGMSLSSPIMIVLMMLTCSISTAMFTATILIMKRSNSWPVKKNVMQTVIRRNMMFSIKH